MALTTTLKFTVLAVASSFLLSACSPSPETVTYSEAYELAPESADRLNIYVPVRLDYDVSNLTEAQQELISLLIDAAEIMDDLFWQQAYPGDKETLLSNIADANVREFVKINYGPWDRLNNMQPILQGYGEKPLGANYYPADMSREEFDAANLPGKDSLYTLVRRNEAGELITIPYHEAYASQLQQAAAILRAATTVADDEMMAQPRGVCFM